MTNTLETRVGIHALHTGDTGGLCKRQRCHPSNNNPYTGGSGSSTPKALNVDLNETNSSGGATLDDTSLGATDVALDSSVWPSASPPSPCWSENPYFSSHFFSAFCRCRLFHPSLALILLIQCSLLLPLGWTLAKGYRLALTVT